jgi:multidrug/hemolysin transport system ATP-binding protein
MEEAAEADNVVILDTGKIVAEGSPLELKNRYASDTLKLYSVTEDEVISLGVPFKPTRDGFEITLEKTADATVLITKAPQLFRDYELTKGKMDDVFLAVTGKRLSGGEEK